jgi:hypothetical protein
MLFWNAILGPLKSYFFREKAGSETGSGIFWKLDPDPELIENSDPDLDQKWSFGSTTLINEVGAQKDTLSTFEGSHLRRWKPQREVNNCTETNFSEWKF